MRSLLKRLSGGLGDVKGRSIFDRMSAEELLNNLEPGDRLKWPVVQLSALIVLRYILKTTAHF